MSIRLGAVRPGMRRALLGSLLAALLTSGLTSGAALAAATPAAARAPQAAPARHVVIVGLSGLRWSDLSPAGTPTLWRLAGQGSVGSLVDFAVLPLTCPADGWLTLNSGARAQSDHTDAGCRTFPAVRQAGAGATVPALPGLIAYNQRFHNDPSWGLLGRAAGCATAVGPGAALALAGPSGAVASYLPSPADLTAGVLSRCPLTVVDLGNTGSSERSVALAVADTELKHLLAELPAATTLLVTAPGATTRPPHLQLTLVDGTGYQAGLLESASTRQPGLVVLTDLTPTVLGWLGQRVPSGLVGAQLTRGNRGPLPATVRGLTGRDTAEQVWRSTHNEFFWAYALADAGVLAAIGLVFWGAAPERRRRRAQWWRVAGVFAVCVPAGTFLANLVPWSAAGPPGGLAVRGGRGAGPGHRAGRAGRHPAARPPRAVRPGVPVHRGRAGPGRDDRIPAAAGDAVRAVDARGRPVLRHRQRGAGHLRRHGAVRRGLAGPWFSPALPRLPRARRWPRWPRWASSPCSRPAGPDSAARWAGRSPWCRASRCC